MTSQLYKDLIIEISKIKRNHTNKSRVSNILLFRDYITKLRLWKIALQDSKVDILNKDDHNIFIHFHNTLHHNSIPDFNEYIAHLKEQNINFTGLTGIRSFEGIFSYLYITWEVCKDFPDIKQYNLSNPYNNLKNLIERTNTISKYKGMLNIDDITFNEFKKYNNYSLPSNENAFLDFIDSKYVFHINGIPNQDETNKLWEEFKVQENY